jgi:hydroxyacylglutathione hydrolase
MLKTEIFVVNHFQENTYLIYDDASQKAVIIDPGAQEAKLDQSIESKNLKVEALLCTHCHPDHIAGAAYYQKKYGADLLLHEKEKVVLDAYDQWAPALGFEDSKKPEPAGFIRGGQRLDVGASQLQVIDTPGHTPGGVCFHCAAQKILYTGDTLFQRSIGRSDFPGGNGPQLINSIRTQLLILPEDTQVFPGHGGSSTIGDEKELNPFL